MMQQFQSKSDLIADYYSQHYEEVKAFVSSRLQYADDSEDVVQNIFLRLLQMDKMISSVTLPCLVYTVARNLICIIRKTKCFRILERNAKISKTKRNFSRLYPTPQKFKKIDRLRRNEIHLKAVRTSS